MAKITIQIDTESSEAKVDSRHHESEPFTIVSPRKIGLLCSGDLSQYLQNAFQDGVGSGVTVRDKALKTGYAEGNINTAKGTLRNCAVIATAGGNVVFAAIKGKADTQTFVSMLGSTQSTSSTNCRGGVILNSIQSNAARISYLRSKGFDLSQIGLYSNKNSNMNGDEESDWNTQTGNPTTPQIINFSGANTTTKANDPAGFAADFPRRIPSGIRAVVISADPFFGANKNALMSAVLPWLTSGRFVIYPLQDYSLGMPQPPTTQGTLYGPDLAYAYKLLGTQARAVFDTGQDAGFLPARDVITEI